MAKKQIASGRKQDRARVAGGQDYEVRYEVKKKTGRAAASVKKPVKKVGNSRKRSRISSVARRGDTNASFDSNFASISHRLVREPAALSKVTARGRRAAFY